MKILVFSDIHTDWKRLNQLLDIEAGAYFCAGDVVSWARGLPDAGRVLARRAGNMYVLPGNHESASDIARLCAEFDLIDFHGRSVTLDGVTISGLGYSSLTPFKTPGEYTEAQMAAELGKLAPAQVLICHSPPKGTLLDRAGEGLHFGSVAVAEYLTRNQPAYFFCGHVHEAEGVVDRLGDTVGVNVGKTGYLLNLTKYASRRDKLEVMRPLLAALTLAGFLLAQGPSALSLEASQRLREGNVAGAEELYTRMSKMSGDMELQGVDGLYAIHEKRGRPEEGMRLFREHYARNHDPMFLVLGASRMAESGREEQAARELLPVIELLKKGSKLSPRVTGTMAFTLRRLGNLEDALAAAKHAEDAFRAEQSLQWVNMGDLVASLLEDQNRTLEALSEYEFIIHEEPDNAWILNNYAYYLAVHGKELQRAEQMARRSLTLDPNNGHTLDTLGFILLKLGKTEDSIDAMVRSWRLHPDEMVVRTHLAQSLAKRKSKAETMQQLLDVLRTEPDDKNTAEIERLLSAIGE